MGQPASFHLLSIATLMPPLLIGVAALLTVAVIFLFLKVRRRIGLKRELRQLRSKWGHQQNRDRDLTMLAEFHQVHTAMEGAAESPIDDQTWTDLNMNAIYSLVDRGFSTCGDCMLYRVLRCPLLSTEPLERRAKLIRAFQEDVALREFVQIELLSMGRANARGLISLVWTDQTPPEGSVWVFYILTFLAALSLVGLGLGSPPAILGVFIMFLANMAVHYKLKAQLMGRLGALRQLGAMIDAGRRIGTSTHPPLADYAAPLRQAAGATRKIARRVSMLTPDGSSTGDLVGMATEYVSIFFLHEVRTFYSAMVEIVAHTQELRTLFRLTGELDAWQSVAAFRAGLSGYSEPQFVEDAARLEIKDAWHPLLPNPVPNSLEIRDAGIAITGSNMAGKTTFLRTVGVNALLAQTIHTCLASAYRARMLRITASMNESDDLLEGKSYYLAEAERLLKMLRESEKADPLLTLIDEPLAGTNSPERLAASREILRYLAAHNGLVIVSTHDVELVTQLQKDGQYEAYHFSDQADEKGIRFDYRLRKGLDYHGNAIAVLKHLGYPDVIIDGALASLAKR